MNDPVEVVTTRRLCIVDEQGRPRIVAEVHNGVAELRVGLAEDPSSHALVYAGQMEPGPGGTLGLGIELFIGGNSMGRLAAWEDGQGWRSSH